ncbi:MAG: bifunctional phosphopantothenoylcysteine decarboxylase/phosphopantothenate--cysteine ligase CoaBC [Clostridiales bacterium]|jgi:phosphopantothenoylcysteine decarboxylase/phosphopantothenate--cysteine ligase|nr:bifunctional phosphopantothenoylcysteine decarboxylase/phosphopantothenate--cysteine ligase CoaBC [Clostridiales bacterium]
MLNGKTVVLGVSGGIAAYKAAELISRLKKLHADTRVCMTKNAQEFITPLTLQGLSQNPVATDLFAPPAAWEIGHISLAAAADVMVIAPATANIIGKIANGIADDIVTTTVMATKAQVILAPAMNTNMYDNPVTQQNLARLKSLGYAVAEPASGRLACGITGRGKLADADDIIEEIIARTLYTKDLLGKKVLVTAGPTREKIDDVRFITNYSSGKMGYAVARAARRRGAEVTLVSGKVALAPLKNIEMVYADSARQMYDAVMSRADGADIIVKAAAVGDFRVKNAVSGKAKKESLLTLELEKNPDILMELGKNKNFVLIGFCMETADLAVYAADKLKRKNPDFIVANDLTREGAGFATDTNVVKILHQSGETEDLPIMSKDDLANEILDRAKIILK